MKLRCYKLKENPPQNEPLRCVGTRVLNWRWRQHVLVEPTGPHRSQFLIFWPISLSLSLSLYIYLYIYVCVCVCLSVVYTCVFLALPIQLPHYYTRRRATVNFQLVEAEYMFKETPNFSSNFLGSLFVTNQLPVFLVNMILSKILSMRTRHPNRYLCLPQALYAHYGTVY